MNHGGKPRGTQKPKRHFGRANVPAETDEKLRERLIAQGRIKPAQVKK